MGADYKLSPKPYTYQPPQELNQPAPVQNTWYPLLGTILAGVREARIYCVAVDVELVNENLEVQAIIDGELIAAAAIAANFNTAYYAYIYPEPINRMDVVGLVNNLAIVQNSAFFHEGREVQLQVRKTSNAGAGDLRGVVLWGQMLP